MDILEGTYIYSGTALFLQFVYSPSIGPWCYPCKMSAPRKASITAAEENVTSVFGRTGDHILIQAGATHDEVTLGALGYKQEFKRCIVLCMVCPT